MKVRDPEGCAAMGVGGVVGRGLGKIQQRKEVFTDAQISCLVLVPSIY